MRPATCLYVHALLSCPLLPSSTEPTTLTAAAETYHNEKRNDWYRPAPPCLSATQQCFHVHAFLSVVCCSPVPLSSGLPIHGRSRAAEVAGLAWFAYCCLLLPTAAYCCLLLPVAACCCLLLPTAAYCCLLLPTAACCCLLLPVAAYCCLLPTTASLCLLIWFGTT